MKKLLSLFKKTYGLTPDSIEPLKGDGSDRRIYRILFENGSVIGVRSDYREENVAFLEFSRHFRSAGLKVPEIYAEDLELGAYLEEDLGDWTLFDWMTVLREKHGFNEQIKEMYRAAIKVLPLFQTVAGLTIDYGLCYQHAEFGDESMTWDLHYFKHRFLDVFYRGKLDADALERDFQQLKNFVLEEPRRYFLYRDFQSRNVMIRENTPHFIDYQSGRRGALQYDVASLLYDAKADLPEKFRQELIEIYLTHLGEFVEIDGAQFYKYFYGFVLMRIMQAFGAYGYLSIVKKKKHFFKSVPFALDNLALILNKNLPVLDALPELRSVYEHLVEDTSLREMKHG